MLVPLEACQGHQVVHILTKQGLATLEDGSGQAPAEGEQILEVMTLEGISAYRDDVVTTSPAGGGPSSPHLHRTVMSYSPIRRATSVLLGLQGPPGAGRQCCLC